MDDKSNDEKAKKIVVAKNAAELQKIRLEKLMKNPVCVFDYPFTKRIQKEKSCSNLDSIC